MTIVITSLTADCHDPRARGALLVRRAGLEVARLEPLGARRAGVSQGDVPWLAMTDIKGNEFCVLKSLPKGGSE